MEENYKEVRGYSLKYFWSDVIEDKELSILMDEKKHVRRRLRRNHALPESCEEDGGGSHSSDGDDNQNYADEDTKCRLKLQSDDVDLFCVCRSYGTQDFVGQRVLQVRRERENNLTREMSNFLYHI